MGVRGYNGRRWGKLSRDDPLVGSRGAGRGPFSVAPASTLLLALLPLSQDSSFLFCHLGDLVDSDLNTNPKEFSEHID